MQRVLITGGSGLLALNWACCMRGSRKIVLGCHSREVHLAGVESTAVDLESRANLNAQLRTIRPDLIVHTAGLTSVDACEQQPAAAMHANAELARNVAVAARELSIRLIHISTDHLFDGTKSGYGEGDRPQPLNAYARTKLQAEQWVQADNPGALIVRTNFFGWGHRYRQSFTDWIIHSLRAGKPITMFDDVHFTPILADALAARAHQLVDSGRRGIINLAGDERISKYDFALRVAAGFDLPSALIRRGKLSASRLLARRPLDMSLDNKLACDALGSKIGAVGDFLAELRRQETRGRHEELLAAVGE